MTDAEVYRDALRTVAFMDAGEQMSWFHGNQDQITDSRDGLFLIVLGVEPEEVIQTVSRYREEQERKKAAQQREMVRELANQIGIDTLCKLAEELKGGLPS